jgi:hypothetical protein
MKRTPLAPPHEPVRHFGIPADSPLRGFGHESGGGLIHRSPARYQATCLSQRRSVV